MIRYGSLFFTFVPTNNLRDPNNFLRFSKFLMSRQLRVFYTTYSLDDSLIENKLLNLFPETIPA